MRHIISESNTFIIFWLVRDTYDLDMDRIN